VLEDVRDDRRGTIPLRFARYYQAVSAKSLRAAGFAAAHAPH
jgi:hypothetical protein